MKLYRASDVPDDIHGMICRESRLAGVVRLVIWSGILAVPVVSGWQLGQQWMMWIGSIGLVIIIPLMLRDLAAQFRAANWVLRISSDSVWINLQSYRDQVSEGVSVVWLDYQEIVSAGRHSERYSTPSEITSPGSQGRGGGDTLWHDEFLELRLVHEQTHELQAALLNQRFPATPSGRPARPAQFRGQHFPAWLVRPDVLRITWLSGHGHVISPGVGAVLNELGTYIRLAEPTKRARPIWRELTPQDMDELACELVQVHGAYAEAVALLVRGGGLTDAEARSRVQRFEADEGRPIAAGHPD